MWSSVIVVFLIVAVLSSLFFGLFYLYYKERQNQQQDLTDRRAVKMLTFRVIFSFLLFATVLISFVSEQIISHVH